MEGGRQPAAVKLSSRRIVADVAGRVWGSRRFDKTNRHPRQRVQIMAIEGLRPDAVSIGRKRDAVVM